MSVKISELTELENVNVNDVIPIVDTANEGTKKITFANLRKAIQMVENPVGHIRMETTDTNPAEYLGFGTWVLWGQGRVPVGVDTTQTEFNTVEKTGGEKAHTITINEMPPHNHTIAIPDSNQSENIDGYEGYFYGKGKNYVPTSQTGGGQPMNMLQPYITCYMWKRTA